MINLIYNNLPFLNSLTRSIQNSSSIIENIAKNVLPEISFAKELKLSALTITTGLISTYILFTFITILTNEPISEEARGKAVLEAAFHKNQEMLTTLLENGTISEEARGEAVIKAVSRKNQEMLTTLLENGPISEEARGRAVLETVFYENQPMLTTLLENGTISEEVRGMAVRKAAFRQNQAIFNALLANESTVPINFLAQIIVNCAKWEQTAENQRQTEYLLSNSLSPNDIVEQRAIIENEIVQIAMENPLSPELRTKIFTILDAMHDAIFLYMLK